MLHHIINGSIKIFISQAFVFTDGAFISFFFCPIVFFLHVSTAHYLGANLKSFFLGHFVQLHDIAHTVPAVHLKGIVNNRLFLVVFAHHVEDQIIRGILHPAFLGINQQGHIQLVCFFANPVKTVHQTAPLCLFVFR